MRTSLVLILTGTLSTACTVGPQYRRPPIAAPDDLRREAVSAEKPKSSTSLADQAWWEILQDDSLRSLIEEALRAGRVVLNDPSAMG